MTDKEIIDLAAEFDLITFGPQDLVMFAREVEAKTIERCARVCDTEQRKNEKEGAWLWEAKRCAENIRALDVPEVGFGNMGENKMTEQTKAQRLAERHEHFVRKTAGIKSAIVGKDMLMEAAAELRRLDALVDELVAALQLARTNHGLMLMSDPPQDAWKYNRVDDAIRAALKKAKEQT